MKKRILAVALALAIAVSLSNTVFAVPAPQNSDSTISFTGTPIEPGADLALFTEMGTENQAAFLTLTQGLSARYGDDPAISDAIATDLEYIFRYMKTGANVNFGSQNLDYYTEDQVYHSNDAQSLSDVIVFDSTETHTADWGTSAGWSLYLSGTAFTETSTNELLDAALDFEGMDERHFQNNTSGINDEQGKTYSIPLREDPDVVVAGTIVSQGTLGYVATSFDALLTVGTKPAPGTTYQSTLTWELSEGFGGNISSLELVA